MIEFSGLNVWAVLVVWIISVALGTFWYSPAGFGETMVATEWCQSDENATKRGNAGNYLCCDKQLVTGVRTWAYAKQPKRQRHQ